MTLEVNSATLTVPDAEPCELLIVCPECMASQLGAPVLSPGPVQYATGKASVHTTPIPGGNGFGKPWGTTSSYSNLASPDSGNIGGGSGWLMEDWFLIALTFDDTTCGEPAVTVSLVDSGQTAIPFDFDGDQYVPPFGSQDQLTFDQGSDTYTRLKPDGSSVTYSAMSGMYVSLSDPAGNLTQVVERAANGFNVTRAQRSTSTPDGTVTEQMEYAYDDPASKSPLMTSMTLTRKTGAGAWTSVSRQDFDYYLSGDSHGTRQDLKSVTTSVWSGSTWEAIGTDYYRYYLSSGSSSSSSSSGGGDNSAAHLLKFVLKPASFERMVADGYDPLTESDATLSLYADFYFEYDEQRRVVLETVKSGSQTYEFSYEASNFANDYNHWQTKTTETLPDGNQNIIYSNYAGMTMLKVFQAGDDRWIDFWRYDENAKVILHAHPSAVTGYDETYADLLNYDSGSGTFEYLRDNDGLIDLCTYHEPSGYMASQGLQQGQLGTPILQQSMTYCQCGSDCGCGSISSSSSSSSGDPTGIWQLAASTAYPSESDPERTIVTSHCYSFYPGTCAVQQHVTTLPVIPTAQNGSGVANSNREYFDEYGNLRWKMDERGFMSRMAYDIPTGAMMQQVQDVDTSLYPDAPAGWSTPSGGGLNLITDFEFDDQGRTTQTLGPRHTIDLNETATVIRTASWTVYDDVSHVTYSGQGYATGTAPDYDYTLVNPVSISKMDAGGRVNEQIQAAAASTAGSLAEIIDAAGGGELAFPQSSYTRWTTNQFTDCCLAASQRVYHTIPAAGAGSSGTNYDETDFGYDVMKRRNRTVSPGGTITDIVYEARGLVIGTYIGTNDDGGTETDPTGGGVDPDNNMVIVTSTEYDGGTDGGDGNLTEVTQHVDETTTRVTAMAYDFRNRNTTTDGEVDYFQKLYYDNLNQVIKTERYDTTILGNLIARSETRFDDLGRVYQSVRYGVDPSTGTVGNSLTDNTWFDQSGNVIKSLPSGSSLATKTTCDSLGRAVIMYRGYDLDETSYADAFTVTDDVILEQSETTFDAASNAILTLLRQRYHNAPDTQTGSLQNPSTTPKARVTYSAAWQDGLGRVFATANYGTNGGTALSRPDLVPNASDTILVSLTSFDVAGNTLESIDPAGMVIRFEYDDRGRKVTQVDNYQPDNSSSSSSSSSSGDDCEPSDDANRTIRYTFTPDGQQATMTAENWRTGDQTTTWTYGTTLDDSDMASSQLLRSVTYPDSGSSSDLVAYSYNRVGQRISLTDQRGCIHDYDYDKLGRQLHDRVTTVGDGVDGTVVRLSTTYEVRGMVQTLTSWNDVSVTSGDAVNQCLFTYNDFQQLIADYQSHNGEVDISTTPSVQYSFADGSANTTRPTSITCPNGRVLDFSYSTLGSIADASSRVDSIVDGLQTLVQYSYLGLKTFVTASYPEPNVQWTMVNLSGSNDPETGDIYSGFDRFKRVKDNRWYNNGTSTDIDRIKHGYDRVGNRMWRQNTVATDNGAAFDELYSYDRVNRLKEMQRGTLNGTHSAILSPLFTECWSMDSTANWSSYRQRTAPGDWSLVQQRSVNQVNEIVSFANSVGAAWETPAYDAAGNMTTFPKSIDPTEGQSAVYDGWNRLVDVREDSDVIVQYQYDGVNRRTIEWSYSSGSLSETRQFFYTTPSQWQVEEERVNGASTPDRQFVWGVRYVDDLVLRDRDTDGDSTLDERLYAVQDDNWNVTAIIEATGDVGERYAYSQYGMPSFLTNLFGSQPESSFDWRYLFTGRRFETHIGLYDFRHRFVSSLIGLFLTRDPLGLPNGPSFYAAWFVPHAVDPSGLVELNSKIGCSLEQPCNEGVFTGSINIDTTGGRAGVVANIKYTPTGGCRCKEYDFIQVAKLSDPATSSPIDPKRGTAWIYDASNVNGRHVDVQELPSNLANALWYRSRTWRPSWYDYYSPFFNDHVATNRYGSGSELPNGTFSSAQLYDPPGIDRHTLINSANYEFETCAVCKTDAKGRRRSPVDYNRPDGIPGYPEFVPPITASFDSSMVLGCISWSFTVVNRTVTKLTIGSGSRDSSKAFNDTLNSFYNNFVPLPSQISN